MDALQRGEVAAGLERVAAPSQGKPNEDVPATQIPDLVGGAAREDQRPEQRGGQHEADGEEGADRRAVTIGELAEDGHGAEGGAGAEAKDCSRGAHGRGSWLLEASESIPISG